MRPAYKEDDMDDLLRFADHVSFNSLAMFRQFGPRLLESPRGIKCGLRINPEQSEAPVPLYDPCAPGSRFGIRASQLEGADLTGITGLHFHTLCEQLSAPLERTIHAVEERFAPWLNDLEWFNFGGGHWITHGDYDVDHLCRLVADFQSRYDLKVYLEPGEAISMNAGYLVSEVLDVLDNEGTIAVLDSSATAHFADVLEMPYTPEVYQASSDLDEYPVRVRLGGLTCLSGDFFGTYSFPKPLSTGDRVVFKDAAYYTMVKTTHFNGVKHPSIAILDLDGNATVVREFGYHDYRDRLS